MVSPIAGLDASTLGVNPKSSNDFVESRSQFDPTESESGFDPALSRINPTPVHKSPRYIPHPLNGLTIQRKSQSTPFVVQSAFFDVNGSALPVPPYPGPCRPEDSVGLPFDFRYAGSTGSAGTR